MIETQKNSFDIIIIGGGPAGLTSAIYATRAGKTALVLEKKTVGGQIVNTPSIENYPAIKNISGFEFSSELANQALSLGCEIKYENASSIISEDKLFTVKTRRNSYSSRAVILATGAKNRELGLQNEKDLIGLGVSYCATCDGAFFKDKSVAVVGGGSTALDDATYLSATCKSVSLIHRRDSFRGEDKLVQKLKEKENVNIILNSVVTSLNAQNSLKSINVKNITTDETAVLDVDGIFIAIGQEPENKSFEDIINIDNSGYIIANENCKTNYKGIFTAGDCRTKNIRQLTTATSDGTIAALSACEYINSLDN